MASPQLLTVNPTEYSIAVVNSTATSTFEMHMKQLLNDNYNLFQYTVVWLAVGIFILKLFVKKPIYLYTLIIDIYVEFGNHQ